LIIGRRRVKPAVIMKTPSGTFAFIGSAVIIMTVFGGCIEQPTGQLFDVKIGDPNANPPRYVALKHGMVGQLQAALAKIKRHHGICDITFLDHDGGTPDPHYCEKIPVSLKTDRVIKSKVASNNARDISAANDPNLMNRIASTYPSDITAVLDLLTSSP
jgi:hypothetical protein